MRRPHGLRRLGEHHAGKPHRARRSGDASMMRQQAANTRDVACSRSFATSVLRRGDRHTTTDLLVLIVV